MRHLTSTYYLRAYITHPHSLDYGRLLRVESHPGFDTPYHTPDSILFSIFKAFCEKQRFDCQLSSFDIDYVEYLLLVRFMLIIYFRDNP